MTEQKRGMKEEKLKELFEAIKESIKIEGRESVYKVALKGINTILKGYEAGIYTEEEAIEEIEDLIDFVKRYEKFKEKIPHIRQKIFENGKED